MELQELRQHIMMLEQQAAELVAQQTELQRQLRHGKLGPIDYQTVKAELSTMQAHLAAVRASLLAAKRQRQRLLPEQETSQPLRQAVVRASWQTQRREPAHPSPRPRSGVQSQAPFR